jgi:hypothetical protein
LYQSRPIRETLVLVKSPEALAREKALHDEMSALSKQQSEALQNAIFLSFTRVQAIEYDARGARIAEICKLLDASEIAG